ncbi:hypothetical protein ACFVKB_10975 [Rhodococcus sp. NPDC127530]|uniref:hypothetical protein n=1 Tax=unclassified Rhodococcus (in: high G+C Gram-positive bacteria) TaxID=192944 RepID=UPI0036451256
MQHMLCRADESGGRRSVDDPPVTWTFINRFHISTEISVRGAAATSSTVWWAVSPSMSVTTGSGLRHRQRRCPTDSGAAAGDERDAPFV